MHKQSLTHPKTYADLIEERQLFLKGKAPLSVHTWSPHYGPFPCTPVSWLTDRWSQMQPYLKQCTLALKAVDSPACL